MVRSMFRTGGILTLALGLLVPVLVYANYNDVTLTSSTVISINGITLNVTGSSNVVQSISVNGTNFTFVALNNSQLSISAPNLNQLSQTGGDAYMSKTCNSSASTMSFSFSNPATVTVTPSATLCSNSSGGGGAVSGGGGGGGGGGSSAPVTTTTTTTNTNTTTTTQTNTSVPSSTSSSGGSQTVGAPSSPSFTRVLVFGSTGSDVTALQNLLVTEGFFSGSPNGIFGPKTRAALKAFQKANGLKITGKADAATLVALGADTSSLNAGANASNTTSANQSQTAGGPITKTLSTGSKGSQVVQLQQELTRLGFYSGPVNGSFGPMTKAAVKAFQKANGITTNGIVGPMTRGALNKGH